MFNGIIFKTGKVKKILKNKDSIYVGIQSKTNLNMKDIGSSVCCDGICLTLTEIKNKILYFYVSNETLKKTNFKNLKKNQIINLEKSLIYGQRISGHFSQGHVDSTAIVKKITIIDNSWLIKFQILDKKLNKFLTEKASICINGVSLTISSIYKNFFEINVIPHTLKLTNLNKLERNSLVNVELDILSKYIYKYSK
jgi:riboflavin synthase